MPGDGKAVARTVAVIALLLLAIVALRGYLPGAEPAPDPAETEPRGPGSVVPTLVLLGVSIVIMAIGLLNRRRRQTLPSGADLPYDQGGGRIRVPWRLLLIATVALLAWSLVVLQLMRWGAGLAPDAVPMADPDAASPDGGQAESAPTGDELADALRPETSMDGGNSDKLIGYLAAATIAFFGLAVVSAVIGRRRDATAGALQNGAATTGVVSAGGVDLARATELGLAEIGDRSRDPREAIIACYAAMERALEKSPGLIPQDSDTPSEVLARAVESRALQAGSAAELVDLFGEARFSPHVMNEGHRADAVRALRAVQLELQGGT